jgi:hypothetical protein
MAKGQAPGRSIPILGGEGDGGQFFVGDTVVLTDAMDAMTSVPVDMGNGEMRVYAYWTFLGRDAETREPKAVTLVMGLDMVQALPTAARRLFLGVPLELRTVGGKSDDDFPKVS